MNIELGVSSVYLSVTYKFLFDKICDYYNCSASEVIRDFMSNYCKIHYLELMEDPLFVEAAIAAPPERGFDEFVKQLYKIEVLRLENHSTGKRSKKDAFVRVYEQSETNKKVETIFGDYDENVKNYPK